METYGDFFDRDGWTNMWGRSNIYRNAATSAFDGNLMMPRGKADLGLHQLIGILFKPSGDVRFILISVPQVPDRPIYIEGPAGIIPQRRHQRL